MYARLLLQQLVTLGRGRTERLRNNIIETHIFA